MRVTIISCFDTFSERVKSVELFFENNGYEVGIIQSNFSHVTKKRMIISKENCESINVIKYEKNLSVRRLISHYFFSKDTYYKIKKNPPDVLYVIVPPNSIVRFMSKVKKEHNVVLVYDINDLWPESFPISRVKNFLPFKIWRDFRKKNINLSDFVVTECELFRDHIMSEGYDKNPINIYHSRKGIISTKDYYITKGHVRLLYLGSINHIIDIEKIATIIKVIKGEYHVTLNIIGDGENREKLIQECELVGAEVIYHGVIFDIAHKRKIILECDFGLNIMKETLMVGLTMKSLDYFQNGLPLINNIGYDTKKIIEKYQCGINVSQIDDLYTKLHLLNNDHFIASLRRGVISAFDENFSSTVFNKKMRSLLKEINLQ